MTIPHPSQSFFNSLSLLDKFLFDRFGFGETIKSPFSCIHHAFEYYAFLQPDVLAVVNFEESITYRELDRQANCLATRLRDMGVEADSRICVLVERSILMVVAMLGVLKAGAAYVPLDGNIVPDSTLAHAIDDSGMDIVLTLPKFASRVEGKNIVDLEQVICSNPSNHCTKPKDLATADGGAYVIFTSGELVPILPPYYILNQPCTRNNWITKGC
jgi:non-ribosomal peptide synthetase component F